MDVYGVGLLASWLALLGAQWSRTNLFEKPDVFYLGLPHTVICTRRQTVIESQL